MEKISPSCITQTNGELSEWFKVTVLKTVVGVTRPWVRIPRSPPLFCIYVMNNIQLNVALVNGSGYDDVITPKQLRELHEMTEENYSSCEIFKWFCGDDTGAPVRSIHAKGIDDTGRKRDVNIYKQ